MATSFGAKTAISAFPREITRMYVYRRLLRFLILLPLPAGRQLIEQ